MCQEKRTTIIPARPSIHGVQKLHSDIPTCQKLLWLSVFIASFVSLLYVFVIKQDDAPIFQVKMISGADMYPDITIANANYIRKTAVPNLTEHKNLSKWQDQARLKQDMAALAKAVTTGFQIPEEVAEDLFPRPLQEAQRTELTKQLYEQLLAQDPKLALYLCIVRCAQEDCESCNTFCGAGHTRGGCAASDQVLINKYLYAARGRLGVKVDNYEALRVVMTQSFTRKTEALLDLAGRRASYDPTHYSIDRARDLVADPRRKTVCLLTDILRIRRKAQHVAELAVEEWVEYLGRQNCSACREGLVGRDVHEREARSCLRSWDDQVEEGYLDAVQALCVPEEKLLNLKERVQLRKQPRPLRE